MVRWLAGIWLGLTLIVIGCGSAGKVKATKSNSSLEKRRRIACADLNVPGPRLDWVMVDANRVSVPKNLFPKQYQVYLLDTTQLNMVFNPSLKNWTVAVPLPEPIGCQIATLQESGTMSAELRQKYPAMLSLAGPAANNATADFRMDYDGNKLRGQVRWGADVFILSPFYTDGHVFYIIYNKKESGVNKAPFESGVEVLERTYTK